MVDGLGGDAQLRGDPGVGMPGTHQPLARGSCAGRSAMAADNATKAEVLLQQALEIFRRIGAAEVPDLRSEAGGSPWTVIRK